MRWNRCPPPLPPYRLIDVIHNEYIKKKHQWGRVPLSIPTCMENLKVFKRIMTRNGILDHRGDWWLSEGSALGAYRERRLLPWDDDVDVCLREKHITKFFQTIWPQLMRAGFKHVHSHPYYYVSLIRKGEKLDIGFLMESKPQQICGAGHVYCSQLVPCIFPTKPVVLSSYHETYYVPGKECYYILLYGKDWRRPQFNVTDVNAVDY